MAKEKDSLFAPVCPPLQEEDMMGVNKSIKQNQDTDGDGWESPGGPRPARVRHRRPHDFHQQSYLKPISGNLGQLSLFS